MNIKDFYKILSFTDSGLEDIISKRSTAYTKFCQNISYLSLEEAFIFFHCEKSLLKLPLIIDDKHLQIGFNSDEIRQFIPRENREIALHEKYF